MNQSTDDKLGLLELGLATGLTSLALVLLTAVCSYGLKSAPLVLELQENKRKVLARILQVVNAINAINAAHPIVQFRAVGYSKCEEMRRLEIGLDVVFYTNNPERVLKAHRFVLSAVSYYFLEYFTNFHGIANLVLQVPGGS